MGGLRARDREAVRAQLGREPATPFTVTAHCPGDHPLVIRNYPVDAAGSPFPTLFWLACPDAVKAVARLESGGWIARMNERAAADPAFAEALEAAHREYATERERDSAGASPHGGVGGTITGVKCLHAHFANHLAGGDDPVGAWVAERIGPVHPPAGRRVAAVDVGTNSIRLLVAEETGSAPAPLARDMVITRIGEGVDATGRLDSEALARTVRVLERYCRRARALGAGRIRVAATSAVRDAADRTEVESAVRERADSELEVLSGEQEAEIGFVGATAGLEAPAPHLVADIGGGSTEFAFGTGRAEHVASTELGSVRLTERLVHYDPPDPDELAALEAAVGEALAGVEGAGLPARDAATLVAVAGTATTVQGIALGLDSYDPDAIHRTELSLAEAERVLDSLTRMTSAERAALPVMPRGREDVIVAGAVVLVATMRRWGFESALVSETDILDGLVIGALGTR